MTALYDLKRGDYFKLLENPAIPPAAHAGDKDLTYKFTHVDGMYAPCHDTTHNNRYYFAAWTEVEQVNEPIRPTDQNQDEEKA
jgi:hypothetical protein